LIAATTILVLTAQRYFQSNPPRKSDAPPANLAVGRRDNFADEISQSGTDGYPVAPFRFRGPAGGTFCGAPMYGLAKTACSPSPQASCLRPARGISGDYGAGVLLRGLFADPSTIGAICKHWR